MIIIDVIDGDSTKTINIPTDWEDMTLNYFCGIHRILEKYRKKEEFIKNIGKEDIDSLDAAEKKLSGSTLDFLKHRDLINMNKDIFQYVAEISDEDIELVDLEEAMTVINAMSIFQDKYKYKGKDRFELDGETYFFPLENMLDNTFGDYIEATQLEMNIEQLSNGHYDVLPQQMAILCRKEGEVYDDDLIEEKTEKFKTLKMDTVMEFSFFLTKRSQQLVNTLEMCSEEKEEEVVV